MFKTTRKLWPATAVVLTLALIGCASGPQEDPMAEEWAALESAKTALSAKRQELADLVAKAAVPVDPEAEVAEGAEATEATEPMDYSAEIDALRKEVTAQADAFMAQVVTFLNNDPIIAEDGPTERQLAAIRLKSAEDMLVSQEWINEGGDYRQAIQILENSLQLDPDNPDLQAALAAANDARFMSQERFDTAKKGMTEAEVRAALGTPLHYNVKTYEDKGVTAWFYSTDETGAAAAVWFRPNKEGILMSYLTKFDAVASKAVEE